LAESDNKMELTLAEEVEPQFNVIGYGRRRMLMPKAWLLSSRARATAEEKFRYNWPEMGEGPSENPYRRSEIIWRE
jgi:hypothetical protein